MLRPAFAECDAKATAFVGGDWRGARLTVQVAPPSPGGWQGGSRWFRCDIFELDTADGGSAQRHPDDHPVQHTGSLRDALKGPSPLDFGCLNEDRYGAFEQTDCARPHTFEYVGSWTAPGTSYADASRDEDGVHAKCRILVARYAKVSVDGVLRYRTGTSYLVPSAEAWALRDRGIRCFYWSGGYEGDPFDQGRWHKSATGPLNAPHRRRQRRAGKPGEPGRCARPPSTGAHGAHTSAGLREVDVLARLDPRWRSW